MMEVLDQERKLNQINLEEKRILKGSIHPAVEDLGKAHWGYVKVN